MNPLLLLTAWEGYREHAVPADAGDSQVGQTRQAFYAGAWVVMELCERIGRPEVSEAAGLQMLETARREIVAFLESISDRIEGQAR